MAIVGRPLYEWGKVLNFTTRGSALPYLASGRAEPEASLIWTDGLNARLSLQVTPPNSDVSLVMNCIPYLAERKVPDQEVHVSVNFLRVGFSAMKAPADMDIPIPKRVFGSANVDIDLYLPKACSPAAHGLGNDIRQLGVAVSRLMLIQA
jgi:hypothetical protein